MSAMDLDELAAAAVLARGRGGPGRGRSGSSAAGGASPSTSASTRTLRSSNSSAAKARELLGDASVQRGKMMAAAMAAAASAKKQEETNDAASTLQGLQTKSLPSKSQSQQPPPPTPNNCSTSSTSVSAFDEDEKTLVDGTAATMKKSKGDSSSDSSDSSTTHSTPEYSVDGTSSSVASTSKNNDLASSFKLDSSGMTATTAFQLPPLPAPMPGYVAPPPAPMPMPLPPQPANPVGGEDGDGGSDYSSTDAFGVPAKKQKGRRPNSSSMENKNHKCPHPGCAWSFSRREHLKRHEKTHTQERPFTCDVPLCGLKFSRLDNLNSHKRTHEKGKRTAQWHVAKVVGGSNLSSMDGLFGNLPYDEYGTLAAGQASYSPSSAVFGPIETVLPPMPLPMALPAPPNTNNTSSSNTGEEENPRKRKRSSLNIAARRPMYGEASSVSDDNENDGEYSDA